MLLQGFTSTASLTSGSVVPILASPTGGFDSDEVEFLLGVVWDKLKVMKGQMSLEDIALGTEFNTLALSLPQLSFTTLIQHTSPLS